VAGQQSGLSKKSSQQDNQPNGYVCVQFPFSDYEDSRIEAEAASDYLPSMSRPRSGLAQRLPRLLSQREMREKRIEWRRPSGLYMTVVWKLTFTALCIFYLVACNSTKRITIEALRDRSAGGTSRFVFPTSGSKAEAYLTRPAGPGPFPLMILLHGHTFEFIWGAESVVPEAEAFASDLCYAGLAVSLPGYGATEVPPALDPKITLNVVLDGVSLVKKLPWVDSKRLYLYGFSRGAFFAALLANRLEGIEGIVLQSGAYDLNRFYQDTLWFRSMLNPNGEENPKLISILPEIPTWHAPTLILHGEKDFLVSVQQANLLRDSLEAAKKPYRYVLYPNNGHRLPPEDVRRKATAFLEENSGSACRPSVL
jgi:pimeloyl-ACP methyl ester carboxylesterase